MKKKKQEEIELIQTWLAFATENLLSAKVLLTQDFSPHHTVCFMCQGSSEKFLKAFLICQGWTLEKTHDLERLLKYCVNYDDSFQELFPACKLLNEYITEGRYPGDLPWEMIRREDADEAIRAAEKIADFITEKISFID